MISAEVQSNVDELGLALQDYAKHSRKSPEQIVRSKGTQIVLGNKNSKFGDKFPGVYELLIQRAPEEGSVTEERQRALDAAPSGTKRPVKVRPSAVARADELLEGQPSGVFDVVDFGRGGRRKRVVPVRIFTKGKRQGQRSISKRAKTASLLRGNAFLARQRGTILNQKNLSILIELNKREAGRGFAAAAFLLKRYRRMRRTKGGSKRVVVKNRSGRMLSGAVIRSSSIGASLRISGFTAVLGKPWAQKAIAQVLRDVTKDTITFTERKEAQALQRSLDRQLGRKRLK